MARQLFGHRLFNKAALALTLVLFGLQPPLATADTLHGQPIYVRNNTGRTIWVAARYVPPGSSSYVTDGFWKVNAGQRMLILYNEGVYIYLHAHDADGTVWDGNDVRTTVRGETVNMFRANTGTGYQPWTMTFDP